MAKRLRFCDGRATLVGYVGQTSDAARSVYAAALESLSLRPMQGRATDGGGEAAFAFVAAENRAMASAIADDGSFLVLNGMLLEDKDAGSLLREWQVEGSAIFEGLEFHGFLAAWNAKTLELQLVRDRFGAETGYYAVVDGGVLFANDQQVLLRLGADTAVHPEAIDAFLTADYFPAPLTPYKSISKLAPGTVVSFKDGKSKVSNWAKYLPVAPIEAEEAFAQIGPVFHESIERMWPDAGDVGMLLSGGIDSAMVAVGISRMLGGSVKAFTFRYGGYEGRLNEGEGARVVADHLGIAHEEILVSPFEMMEDLDSAVAMYGEPFNWGLHTYKLGPIAEQGIKTVFSGSGADGTSVAKRHAAAYRFNALPGAVRSIVRTVVRGARPLGLGLQDKAEWTTRRVDGLGELFSEDSELRRMGRAALYRDPSLVDSGSRLLSSIYASAASSLPQQDQLSLAVLDKVFTFAETGASWNRAFGRGNGLEVCSPFVRSGYFNLGLGAIGTNGKDLMRRLAGEYLPEKVTAVPKHPQEMPVDHWIRGSLADSVKERLSNLPTEMAAAFDPTGVRSVVDRHISGEQDRGWTIISLLTLESWFRQQAG